MPPAPRVWPLAVASGTLYAAAFPPLGWWPLTLVALVPLLLALRAAPLGRAAGLGGLAGVVACVLAVAPSIWEAAMRYFGGDRLLALTLAAGIPALHGVPSFVAFALLAARLQSGGRSALVTVPALAAAWVAAETLRTVTGAPWILLAHAPPSSHWLVQSADLGGAALPAFVIGMVNAGVALALATPARRARTAALACAGVALAAAWAYGRSALARCAAPTAARPLTVAIVQPDLSERARGGLPALGASAEHLTALTRVAVAGGHVDLVVWPENALGVPLAGNERLIAPALALLPPDGRLLLGGPRVATDPAGRPAFHNAAHVLAPDGHEVGGYDKRRLTPYGEFVPWLARPFAAARIPGAPFAPGAERPLPEVAGRPFGVVVCWEAIDAGLVRAAVRDGATFVVNVSNDDWFGGRAARRQHLAAAALRAVEARRALVRATDGGLTGIVDACGVMAARADPDRAVTLRHDVVPRTATTLYARTGDVFGAACTLAAVALALAGGRRRRASGAAPGGT